MSLSTGDRFPNRLITTASPYLLQHAHNPVDWFPWGPEALDKAKREDKPILVSIGYSTCHWCHVMERESFEDDHVAAFMNRHFVNIKVDREERPDIDQLYMDAVQMISGSGGWPLNCFLTPDGRPFYGGTYFPPQPMGNRPSWSQVLQHLTNLFQDKREVVESQADRLIQAVRDQQTRHFRVATESEPITHSLTQKTIDHIADQILEDRDKTHGGFGPAPKFPRTMSLEFLLAYAAHTGHQEAADHVRFSLEKMMRGGIYDQIGGGMARYATDPAWLIPHFEKMLYDNALLVDLLSKWCRFQENAEFEQVVRDTIQWANRELSHPMGGFYSALDADSEGVEGKFYVWDHDEFTSVAGEEFAMWTSYLDVTPQGNWEETNILHRRWDDATFAASHHMNPAAFHQAWRSFRARLFDRRSPRIRPGLDDKVILSWNALMIDACLSAFRTFGDETHLERARQALGFINRFMRKEDGSYFRIYAGGQAYQPAFLDDLAFLLRARIHLLEIEFTSDDWAEIHQLANDTIKQFYDPLIGAFRSSSDQELQSTIVDTYDSALPSGNAVMAEVLDKIYAISGDNQYGIMADTLRWSIAGSVERFPSSFAQYAQSMMTAVRGQQEIVVTGPEYQRDLKTLLGKYLPGTLVIGSDQEQDIPLFRDRVFPGKTYLYLCRDQSCQLPVSSVAKLVEQL